MTDPAAGTASRVPGERRVQVRAAALVVAGLAVLGALLGEVWQTWSPPGPIGVALPDGVQPDETEAWVAGDGHYALIAVVVGIAAAVLAWYLPVLRRARGPYVVAGLAIGGLAGAALTDLVGWALRGDGTDYRCGAGTCIDHLPLTVHMHGLWFVEAFCAVLVYGLFVAFAVADDLGRPDGIGARQPAPADPPPVATVLARTSVGPQHHPQHGGGDRDAAGAP